MRTNFLYVFLILLRLTSCLLCLYITAQSLQDGGGFATVFGGLISAWMWFGFIKMSKSFWGYKKGKHKAFGDIYGA